MERAFWTKRLWLVIATTVIALLCGVCLVACGGDDGGTDVGGEGGNGDDTHTHSYVNYEYNNDATCVADGTETAKCEKCDETDTRTKANTATGEHIYESYTYNNDATCVDYGTETAQCKYCDNTDTRINANTAMGVHSYSEYLCENCNAIDPNAPITEGLKYSAIEESGSIIGYSVSQGNATIEKYLKIPSEYEGKPVTSIGYKAFGHCDSLTSVMIPNSVKSIGNSSFEQCYSLTSIEIPNSVTSIGDSAFEHCNSLTSIEIPDSVTSIGDNAFACHSVTIYCEATEKPSDWSSSWTFSDYPVVWDCKNTDKDENGYVYSVIHGIRYSLKDGIATVVRQPINIVGAVVILKAVIYKEANYSVTSIGRSAFEDCFYLTSITIPNSVTSIGDRAFNDCQSLASIEIPNSVTSIGSRVFVYCDSLTSIAVASGNTNYHSSGNCIIETENKTLIAGFKSSVIPTDGSVTSIGDGAFSGCGLTSIEIPSSVTSIGNSAFSGCRSLTSIKIPNSVTSIGDHAFSSCGRLTSITIPNSVTSIGDSAFEHCSSLTNIAFAENSQLTSIGNSAFYWCSEIKNIEIPSSVMSIGRDILRLCDNIETATIPTIAISSITKKNKLWEVNINGGESIEDKAFYECGSLISVTISNSVTSIGSAAFFGCSSLTSVVFAENSQLTIIGGSAFGSCSNLTSIDIPSSVTTIGGSAFYDCSGLTSITIPNNVTDICDYAFGNCSSLTSIDIPSSVTTIGNMAFEKCIGLTSITIPNSVISIERYAFYNCHKAVLFLEATSIPSDWSDYVWEACHDVVCDYKNNDRSVRNNIYSIIDGVHYQLSLSYMEAGVLSAPYSTSGAIKIKDVVTYKGVDFDVTIIDDYAFYNCSSLISVELPGSITYIGECAFYNCSSLKSVIIPNSVVRIERSAFYGCSSLTSVELPSSVEYIGDYAFVNCSSLTSVTIPSSVEYIGYNVFVNCSLTSIKFNGTIEQWEAIRKKDWNDRSEIKTVVCDDGTIQV